MIQKENKTCNFCNNNYQTYFYESKFCSKNCYNKWRIGKFNKENHYNWKGLKVTYNHLHRWLKNNFGKANKCEMCGIKELPLNKNNYFHWAKLKDKPYERSRNNFWMLCAKCHIKYDGVKRKKKIWEPLFIIKT